MADDDPARAIIKEHERLREERRAEEPDWRSLARMFKPDEIHFDLNEVRPRRDDDEILDGTPLTALDNFVGGMFSQSCNPASRWMEIEVEGDEELSKWHSVAQWTYRVTNRIYGSLAPGVSAFYSRMPAALASVGAHGFSTLYQEEMVGEERIADMVLPTGEIFLDRNPAGEYDRVHREFILKGHQFKKQFGTQWSNSMTDDKAIKVIHCVWPNDSYDDQKMGAAAMPWASSYVSEEVRAFHKRGGYHELPYHVLTWSERSRSAYPTGPGRNALPDARMLQEMEYTNLRAAQFVADPVLLTRQEEALSAADIEPGTMMRGNMTADGKPLVQTLENKGDLRLSLAMSEQRRQAIRSAFFFSMMQAILERPQMTATEFLGFKEEDLKLLAPHLVRIQQGLSSFIVRRFRILQRAGQFNDLPPPQELQGKRLAIRYVSPLARLIDVQRARGVLQLQSAIEQMAVTDPGARDHFNTDAAVPIVRRGFTEVPDVLRDPREIAQMRQQRAQAQQQAAQLEQMGQAVSIAAEAGHAQQAASLAGERGGPPA